MGNSRQRGMTLCEAEKMANVAFDWLNNRLLRWLDGTGE